MSHWMFKCSEISKKVSESFDRSFPLHERIMIRLHLVVCKYCARFKKHLVIIRQAIRAENDGAIGLEESVLSSDARERIKRLLQEQADSHL